MSEKREKTEDGQLFTAPDFRILIIDDNAVSLRMMRSLLHPYGCFVDTASDGFEALELLGKQPVYDMLLIDYRMPQMDGVETLGQIRACLGEYGRNVTAVAMTADEEQAGEMFIKAGFRDVLSKPPLREQIYKTMSRLVPENRKCVTKKCDKKTQEKTDLPESICQLAAAGIDVENGIRRCGGSVGEYIKILKIVAADGRNKIACFEQCIKDGDYELYGIEAHAFKSVAAGIGAWRQSEIAKEHEMAVKNVEYEFINREHKKLINSYYVLLNQVQRVLDKEDDRLHNNIGQVKKYMEEEKLLKKIEKAADALADFRRKDAVRILEELSGYDMQPEAQRTVKEAGERCALYEDDEAEKLLRDFIHEGEMFSGNL